MPGLQFGATLSPHQWRDAPRIEELGYDSVWTSEHLFFYFPTFDALTTLAAAAAITSRIRLGTAVLLLPPPRAAPPPHPKPPQPGAPPLWIPGRSQAALRRAGRLGDGYLPYL